LFPSRLAPSLWTMNIEIGVPSRDGYQTCSTTKGEVSTGSSTFAHSVVAPLAIDVW